ncbi:SigE family RNA polymerase sigma factor [Stackebrandtia albiflava]|uniref:SigE family RNA polymerase sigma factor n=1 Tax=Stackebrandtia albiflava TaxID=406432 RepID=UPI0011BD9953|nr:SigE family RNA polymerase sigma factor [Stackebrandtia albiflava]
MNPESEAEYREFVVSRYAQLGRFAYVLCRDWHQAEDVVQKALTKLYLHWPKAVIRSPDAYVRRIIANGLSDDRRTGWFRRERPSRELPDRPRPDPAEGSAERMTVLHALSRLPAGQRLAVVLRHWEDMSVEQAAEIMGCSTGNVKSQTARGLQTLRGLLVEESNPMQANGANR